jgi:hypothetical protein
MSRLIEADQFEAAFRGASRILPALGAEIVAIESPNADADP